MDTDEYRFYVEDGEGVLGFDERLRRAREAGRSRRGATFSGATLTEGTSKPSGLGVATTQDPSSPPNNVNVNLPADTEVGRTCNEDVLEQGNSGNRQNVTTFAGEADVQSEPAVEGSAAEMAAEDANSVPLSTDSVPVSDRDAVMVGQPPIAGDGATVRQTWGSGSPYTNPMHGSKGGRKGLKSTATVKTGSGHRSPSTVHGDVVNDEVVISVVSIAVVPGEGEVDAHAVPDAALKMRFADDVLDTSTFDPSPHVPAPRTRGTGSKFVICEEVSFVNPLFGFRFKQGEGVKAYLTWTFSPMELDLLAAVRARNFDLPEVSEKHVNAEFLKGLINVVPTWGVADRPGRYCIGLQLSTVNGGYVTFLQGLLSKPEHAARDIWETLKAQQDSNLRYKVAIGLVLMKLVEFTDVLRWETEHADCPQQDNGHDCGVYMLMFMDLLSIRADGLYFGQPYVRQARDKLLLSLLQGSVAHFPQAFL
ncbi:hypothetical protein Cgig2_006596 [Carnegiea gigantea]|uniref:Ubiquitin-like protease family profile domain-containing protein n=1 Tax=Carnegiea gigantea TaxID=171969 RepID=A0A9Q1QLD1_9CARY|nr:hypothetical protein Cgig2_006596 [Carnegiea gigantea]